jgi:hypothetical protein
MGLSLRLTVILDIDFTTQAVYDPVEMLEHARKIKKKTVMI